MTDYIVMPTNGMLASSASFLSWGWCKRSPVGRMLAKLSTLAVVALLLAAAATLTTLSA